VEVVPLPGELGGRGAGLDEGGAQARRGAALRVAGLALAATALAMLLCRARK
jgi:hypothetical protein